MTFAEVSDQLKTLGTKPMTLDQLAAIRHRYIMHGLEASGSTAFQWSMLLFQVEQCMQIAKLREEMAPTI